MDPIQTLLDDYNFYRMQTNHYQQLRADKPFIKLPRLNPERRKLLEGMAAWCGEKKIDPRHWLYCLFAKGRWLYSPKWQPGSLQSETALSWYREKAKRVSDRLYRERLAQTRELEEYVAGIEIQHNPAKHLTAETEGQKARWQRRGDRHGCLEAMQDANYPTGGWHPESKVCPTCELVEACKVQLRSLYPYDVVALREGKLSSVVAQQVAVNNASRP